MIVVFSIFILRYKIITYVNNTFFNKEVSILNLTNEKKISDFKEFYNNITESVPLLSDQEALYGISFKNKKDYYLNLIKGTKNDFEFFCTMLAIEEDIPSMHTNICLPVYSNILDLNCYNLNKTLSKYNIKPLTEYWYKTMKNACKQFSKVQAVNFKYINGQYLFDPMYSGDDYKNLQGFELVSINKEPTSKYVVNNISTYNLEYDYKRKVSYRYVYTLNDSVGQKVSVTLINPNNGSTINKELYVDIQIEVVNTYGYLFKESKQSIVESSNKKNIYSYSDNENNIGYVEVKNFTNSQGKELATTIESMKKIDNIIIDLRNNYGGLREYSMNYLYSPLYSDNVTVKLKWFVPSSNSNKIINNDLKNRLFYQSSKDDKGFYYTRKFNYKGKSSEKKQNIYYLINLRTGSAADGYVNMIKENKLGTIIGTNTNGEGIADSFYCSSLKNSGLVYIYFPGLSYNKDGTDNSLYGTSPDIYIEQTKDSFYKERSLSEKQVDISLYTEKIKYDTVLIKTIEMIQQGNDEITK